MHTIMAIVINLEIPVLTSVHVVSKSTLLLLHFVHMHVEFLILNAVL